MRYQNILIDLGVKNVNLISNSAKVIGETEVSLAQNLRYVMLNIFAVLLRKLFS